MKKLIILFILFAVILGCIPTTSKSEPVSNPNKISSLEDQLENLTKQIIGKMDKTGKKKIAIIEFSNLDGEVTEFGKFLSEELITRIFMTNRFEVIERQMLNKVLEEQNMGTSGLLNDESAVSIGKILGVEAIISGSITDMGSFLKINSRLISTETGTLFSVASIKIFKDSSVIKLMGEKKPLGITTNLDKEIFNQKFTQKLVRDDVSFEIIGCEMNDRTVTISMNITNNTEDDRNLNIRYNGPGTHIFDNMGNEYYVTKIDLANTTQKFGKGAGFYGGINKMLIAGVPIRAMFHFSGVKSEAEFIAMFEMTVHRMGSLKFRNLKILK